MNTGEWELPRFVHGSSYCGWGTTGSHKGAWGPTQLEFRDQLGGLLQHQKVLIRAQRDPMSRIGIPATCTASRLGAQTELGLEI